MKIKTKSKKPALIRTFNGDMTPNGRERYMVIRSGKKGAGKELGKRIYYWPWSSPSVHQADRYLSFQMKELSGEYDIQFEQHEEKW